MSFFTFPEALKGQSAASILRTVAECTNCARARDLHAASLRRCAPLINSLPCRAKLFCQITEGVYGDAEHILSDYSLRAWQALGMSEASFNCLTASLINGRYRTPCTRLLPLFQCQNRTELVCPECALNDWQEHGHPVQYCAHCIDYVTRCYRDGALLESDGEGSTYEGLFCKEGTTCARRNSLLYARTAIELCEKCHCIDTWPAIVAMLTEKGYVRESGRWAIATLQRESERFFAEGFEDPRLSEIARLGDFWVSAIRAFSRGRPIHPATIELAYIFATEADDAPVRKQMGPHEPTSRPGDDVLSAKRLSWLNLLDDSSDCTRKGLRKKAAALWSWLYRNDRDWFVEHQPQRSRRVGGRRVRPLPACVEDAIYSDHVDPRSSAYGRAPLPSAYQMRVAHGMTEFAFNRAVAQFGGVGAAAVTPASKEVFVARRIQSSVNDFAISCSAAPTVIARAAALRPVTVERQLSRCGLVNLEEVL
ncbi:TnsD family Tn7-like transposition protein [Caballeronia sp. BCC1704]|uniref:TnsD family Tn7-like transposition protein n=1 Tax=Caballeronia sp. BCC1704 TaxID=2676300 RepID=UPI00158D88CE|nr:TnsD family Tn7-like transposition protein [Caballeronia sp. BCC1704]